MRSYSDLIGKTMPFPSLALNDRAVLAGPAQGIPAGREEY
jgi:hypothetical protein